MRAMIAFARLRRVREGVGKKGGGVRRGKGRGCGEHCCVVLEILKYFDPELILEDEQVAVYFD